MALAALLILAACAINPTPEPTARATPIANPSLVVTKASHPAALPGVTPTTAATPSSTPVHTPTRHPTIAAHPRIVVLAENLAGLDDLALGPDGSIFVSNVNDGTVKAYTPDGRLTPVVSGISEPEGMVVLPDGSLIIAEQGKNRLVRYDLATKKLTSFLDLDNKTSHPGVDGIALDARNRDDMTIIIPDSPNGAVLRAGLDGKIRGVIGRGFARPTGAWVEQDGSVLVVDEAGSTLKRIRPDGTLEVLAKLPVPDDVIADEAGNIFVNTLGDNAIHLIPAGSTQDAILVGGLSGPQAIILDAVGNLVVTDTGHSRLIKIVIR